jgi:trehalose 6-phosphate phosphatase
MGRIVASVRADALAATRDDPSRSAILLDVDGTLAPIAPRPELAVIPDETRRLLRRLVGGYLLVACISGRAGADAARLVGVPGVRVVGNHGLELDPHADALAGDLAAFRARAETRWPVEDKRLTLSLHFREARDEAEAIGELQAIADDAVRAGFEARWGRKVLEIRPRVEIDKGTAVRRLLTDSGARRALYAGDDSTDLDAFRGLTEAGLEFAVRVAVRSGEAPTGLAGLADVVVEGPEGLRDLLEGL